ncbi:cell surface hyaluronidase [Lingula anatina]|uniref:Cell surface hyaluronidase n=1 Tax=Lingula anatina TaxID=7574 RepID=A0A2R2MT39_LINAN|nr:cell surface hyaluronidase [Lingula anatina]|eukprot:XP_023933414.1 cell surface hyaluronidase [Lingula anatina]
MAKLCGVLCFIAWLLFTAQASCPDKESQLQLWRPGNNPAADVIIPKGKRYLLDRSTTVKSITIQDGGKLVFKDGVAPIVVKTKHILVEDGGEMHIGSPDCRYQGNVTIVLQGKSTDAGQDPNFGKKFIGVTKGGTLEIHGKAKTAWTFLQGHLTGPLAEGAVNDPWVSRGLNVRVIDRLSGNTTERQAFDTYYDQTASQRLVDFLKKQKNGDIIVILAVDEASTKLSKDAKDFLTNMGSKEIGNLRYRDPWTFITIKGTPSETVEQRVKHIGYTTMHYAQTEKQLTNANGQFRVFVRSGWDGPNKWASGLFELTDVTDGHVITLADDVSSWKEGDRVVISSTDISMYQAEEFVIGKCDTCSRYQVKIMGRVNYVHFGGSSYGVDMRAEVGLLSRNIVIKGEMEPKCYGDNFCQFFDYDTFGGHLKILKGFKSVHLSGVEFFNMGQQIPGSYPIHFHMCGDVDELGGYTNPTWVKDLSIHHSFSRCVTIHATNGLLVQNVVGYDALGHCFFLEDGNEQRNTLDHNLGLLTKPGTILPSDRNTKMCKAMKDNVIAGYTPSPGGCYTTMHYAQTEKQFTNANGQFRVFVRSGWDGPNKWASGLFELTDVTDGHVITLADDVSSWKEGDRVVISSTDLSMYQAEEFVIGKCDGCSRYQVKIMGRVNYVHFGGSSYGVDMRAEVGLLSRNIVIKGEMEPKCYGDNFCQFFDYDTFGGNLKILKGFKSVHLSGVEFFNMGQQIPGSYPIHFHMCGDVDELGGYTNPTWVKDLSIHHSFSRCVTIHATNGLLVQNVVGYDALGHCFFLEDGNEQRNTLDHNLGLLTKPGTILPSDRNTKMCKAMKDNVIAGYTPSPGGCNAVTTFWIAHPNNTFTNNAAGGSASVGFWFVFHREPTGPSKGTLPMFHCERTPIKKFSNNRAHSNMGKASLMLDDGVKTSPSSSRSPAEYLSMTGARHAPHVDADINKPRSPSIVDRFTAYKSPTWGIWARGGDIIIQNSRFSDITTAVILASEGVTPFDAGSHQTIRDTIFVGESENRGSKNLNAWNGNWVAGFDGKMRMMPSDKTNPKRAIAVYDGPISIERCQFKRYVSQYNNATAAIGFLLRNGWQLATTSRFTGISFDDVTRHTWVGRVPTGYYASKPDRDGDKTEIFHDEDGSVTGYKDSYVVRTDNHLLRHAGCVEKPEWNAAVCKGSYAQMWVRANTKVLRMSMTRTDHPDKPIELVSPWRKGGGVWNQYQPSMLLGQTYTIHWDGTSPATVQLHPINFNKNDNIIVGLCYPIGTTFKIQYQRLYQWQSIKPLTAATSLAGVKNGDGSVYFWDAQVGLLFLKITTAYNREGWNYCSTQGCEYISIEATIPNGATSVCPGQAYPKYQQRPASILIG